SLVVWAGAVSPEGRPRRIRQKPGRLRSLQNQELQTGRPGAVRALGGVLGDYPYWRKPQHQTMEWLKVPDGAARYALLRSKQADMVTVVPFAIAKDLPRSEDWKRGVNPKKGPLWTQTLRANGKMQVAFDLEMALKEGKADRAKWGNDPTLNPKVREALA